MTYKIKQTEQKALEINLDDKIYGTFSEVGAGQEVANNFFHVGASSGTIAKTMSAYDKTYSDAIYGIEESGRYVCESRLYKMLDHEYELLEERLKVERPETCFFVFADTVSAINYHKSNKGHGWLGVRFQLDPNQEEPNEVIIHTKMLDNDTRLQQEAIGLIGVNLLYACFKYHDKPQQLICSLVDHIKDRVEVDMIRVKGPDFRYIDNRLMGLYLVKHRLTDVTMFDEAKNTIHASEFLYKKHLMVVRGHYQPPTIVSLDVLEKSLAQFKSENDVLGDKAIMLAELTLENLEIDGEIDEFDFLSRADLLSAIGQKVMVTNCKNHQKLINYLSDYKIQNLGLVIGVRELHDIIAHKYEHNKDGRLLVAFGELFTRNIKIYVYPALEDDQKTLMTASNLRVPEGIRFLYKHLLDSQQIVEVENPNTDLLHIYPNSVHEAICKGDTGWEVLVPNELTDLILQNGMFCPIDKKPEATS